MKKTFCSIIFVILVFQPYNNTSCVINIVLDDCSPNWMSSIVFRLFWKSFGQGKRTLRNLFYHFWQFFFKQIPDFAGFWILSVFIQTPLQIYLMTSEPVLKYTTSIVVQGFQCALLVLQVGSSFSVIRRASHFRREQFQSQKSNILEGRQNSKISIISV